MTTDEDRGRSLLTGLLLLTILVARMPPGLWSDNEEHYLGAAWRRLSPDEVASLSALVDGTRHRLLYEWFGALSIELVGIEWTHYGGRLGVCALYAIALTWLFRLVSVRTAGAVATLLMFLWMGEEIVAREWLFRGFEPKTLAYPLVLLGLCSALQKRALAAGLLLGLATWCHFLVGGFWAAAILGGLALQTRSREIALRSLVPYLLMAAPMVLLILGDQAQSPIPGEPDPDWIYTWRSSHHAAPFMSRRSMAEWYHGRNATGLVRLAAMTLGSVVLMRASVGTDRRVHAALLALLGWLWLALALTVLDSQHRLAKLYLFRPASLVLLLWLIAAARFIQEGLGERARPVLLVAVLITGSVVVPDLKGHDLVANSIAVLQGHEVSSQQPRVSTGLLPYPAHRRTSHLPKAVRGVVAASATTDVFLIDPRLQRGAGSARWIAFERLADRPTLVGRKYTPAGPRALQVWYRRLNERKELFSGGCPAELLSEVPRIRYLVTTPERDLRTCGRVVAEDRKIVVFEVSRAP